MQKDQRRVNPEPRVERGAGHAYASQGRDQTYVEIGKINAVRCQNRPTTEDANPSASARTPDGPGFNWYVRVGRLTIHLTFQN